MKPVTVAASNSPVEAEPLKRRLVAAGIPAEIRGETTLDDEMEFARVTAGVRIEVPRANFEAALAIVYDWNAAPGVATDVSDHSDAARGGTIAPRIGGNHSARE